MKRLRRASTRNVASTLQCAVVLGGVEVENWDY